MIGTSGAEGLSRAAGDERLQRVQRSENNPDRRQRRDSKRRQPGADPDGDTVEVAATHQGEDSGEEDDRQRKPEPEESAHAKESDSPQSSHERSPHIDVKA